MKSTNNNVRIIESYGMSGMKITLNLAQCQKLSEIYHSLCKKEALSQEEQELGGFLVIFKDIESPSSDNLWDSLHPEKKTEDESLKILGKIHLD